MIPKLELARHIVREGKSEWFSTWVPKLDFLARKPSEYIEITPEELVSLLRADGYDISTVSYAETDPCELIVQEDGMWLAFNQERGQRFQVRRFATKEEAELFTAEKLIKMAKLVIKMRFDDPFNKE